MFESIKSVRAVMVGITVATAFGLTQYSGNSATLQSTEEVDQSRVPHSVEAEHSAIQNELLSLTLRQSAVGKAARNLASLLEPHFEREEQIALPPLTLLQPLATRSVVVQQARMVALSDSLRAELPRMLQEHKKIAAAVSRLERAALDARDDRAIAFAYRLQLHALNEEEIMYPAAILVAEIVRGRAVASEQR
ncbi:MAG: hemerythrin domain-containing protein [Gemmatimonadota bacterium]